MRSATFAILLAVLLLCANGLAAAPGVVLEVPSAPGTLHLTLDAKGAAASACKTGLRLVDAADPGAAFPLTAVPKIGPDGKPAKDIQFLATVPPREGNAPRRFRIEPARQAPCAEFYFCNKNDKSLELRQGDRPVLVYNHGVITNESLPEKETRRSRACFVHPLYGLHGETLTDAFPKDHYHHLGLFWAWPHVQIEGQEYDLWMYKNIQQRFVAWLGRETGAAGATLGVENGWFVEGRKVLTERVWLRVFPAADGHRAIDIDLVLIPEDRPVTLWGAPGKSYGGLNFRYPPRQETAITVPSGRTKADLPDTRLAWADLTAQFPGAPCPTGAAIFVSPEHPDFPPTWLTRHYGILCVGWPGVKPRTFEPGKPVRLTYRIYLHDGPLEAPALQHAYDAYAAGLKVRWE